MVKKKKILMYLLLGLGGILLFQYNSIEKLKKGYKFEKDKIIEDKTLVIIDVIKHIREEALTKAEKHRGEIKESILAKYEDDKDGLEKELEKVKKHPYNSPIIDSVAESIEGESLNGIRGNARDNNDLVVWLSKFIIGDFSFNCAIDTDSEEREPRDFSKELDVHYSYNLAEQAYQDIIRLGKTYTMWHYLYIDDELPWAEDIRRSDDTSLVFIKNLLLEYEADLGILKGIEFLSVARIDNTRDILGEDIVTPNGNYNINNNHIHVAQGFNLIDQLSLNKYKNFMLRLQIKNERLDNLENVYIMEKMTKELQLGITIILFIMIFLYIEHKKENDKEE